MDPIDEDAERQLLGKLSDEQVPLDRRILIDEVSCYRSERPWTNSPERMTLLDQWAHRLKSADEARELTGDLMGFFIIDRKKTPWPSLPDPKGRAAALIDAVRTIQNSTVAPVETKGAALLAVVPLADGATRGDAFRFLMGAATGPSVEIQDGADHALSGFLPFSPSERSQIDALLKAAPDPTSWQWLRRALGEAKKPSRESGSP